MKRLIIIFIANLLIAGVAIPKKNNGADNPDEDASNKTIVLKGTVLDNDTKEELVCAKVYVEGTQFSTCTDVNGNYEISGLIPGEYNIKVAYISYKEKVLSNVKLKQSNTEILNIELETL